MKYHKTKDGRLIKLCDLELSHLQNIILLLERRAKEGVLVQYGGNSYDVEGIWYAEEMLYGKEALEHLNYKLYKEELNTRLKAVKN